MHRSRRFRLSALLAGAAVIAASLLPALPAAAEEPPSPDPVVTSEPIETPAPDATETPVPVATDAPGTATPEPTTEPTPEVTPTDEPVTESPAEPAKGGVEYAGTFAGIADESGGDSPGTRALFQVPGYGYLSVDTAGMSPMDKLGTKVVTFAVPKGLKLTGSARARFEQLAAASLTHPLTVNSIRLGFVLGKQTGALVNQTPVATATHRIYAVLVSPNNRPKGANQTAAKVQTSVDHADDFWSQQSGGNIQFDLVGTTSWYKTSTTCKTTDGAESLWNKAAAVAKTQLGYVAGRNNHLVLFFPSDPDNDDCAGMLGLGSIGDSANSGGVAWVIGTDSPIEQATLTHELGHNLSLGHADWLDCSDLAPVGGFLGYDNHDSSDRGYPLGTTDCTKKNYGDKTDVMGFGQTGKDGGALSSAQAIRSGIWGPESATSWQTVAATGTPQSFTLNPVSSNTGLRGVVVQDDDGVNYFVEFRNFTDEDAQFSGSVGCTANSCIAPASGVRVLRLENNWYKWNPDATPAIDYGFLGFPGDDSFLIGRTDGTKKINYTAVNDTFWSKGSTGIKIQVTAISGTSATIAVTKSANSASTDSGFRVFTTSTYDSKLRVGDVLTAFAPGTYDAQSTTFAWYRGDTPTTVTNLIGGATSESYKLTAADLGKWVRGVIVGTSTVSSVVSNVSASYPPSPYGFGNSSSEGVAKGVYGVDDPGDVEIYNLDPFTAHVSNWPSGTTWKYQWYRGSSATTATSAISGATQDTYAGDPVKDYYKFLRVRVIASVPGYADVTRYSTAYDYTVHNSVLPALSSTRQVGTALTANISGFVYTQRDGGPLSGLTPSYQWLRDGKAITGADATDDGDYTLQTGDYGKKVSVKVTSTKPGFIANVVTSAAVTINVKGEFSVVDTPAVNTSAPLTLSVTPLIASDVSPAADKATIQWYRGTSKISGATKGTYKLTSSDFGKEVTARITYSKSGYNNRVQTADPGAGNTSNWWLRDENGVPTFTGVPAIGQTLTSELHAYSDAHAEMGMSNSNISYDYQWLRNGVAITATSGHPTTGPSYIIQTGDRGKTISLKVTAKSLLPTYLLPNVATSAPTQVIGDAVLPGWDLAATVTQAGLVLTAHSGVSDVSATSTYQWMRGDAAISKQTKQTYTLTASDYGKQVWVKVTSKKSGFTVALTVSAKKDYSTYDSSVGAWGVRPSAGTFGDPIHVGEDVVTLRPSGSAIVDAAGDPVGVSTNDFSYVWYRSGVAISGTGVGSAGQSYTLQPADLGKTISVKITANAPSGTYVNWTYLSKTAPDTQKVLAGSFNLSGMHPAVTVSASRVATAYVEGTATPAGPYKFSYRWLRNGATISGKTTSTYTLTSSDTAKRIEVIVTISKTGYVSEAWGEVLANGITGDHAIGITGAHTINQTISGLIPTYTTATGVTVTPTSYQWLRDGTPIPGETGTDYVTLPTDSTHNIRFQATVKSPYHATLVDTSTDFYIN